ncbi:MAG: hypothetical protein PHN55_15665 [Dysgonamonadaceae bacterium]|nr:hypothetical protein [Dysgonamonadaceae bacterium]
MPSWSTLLNEANNLGNPQKAVECIVGKKKYFIQKLSERTGRNTIVYFSAFLHKDFSKDVSINDKDINAFMENVHGLDKTKGLDLLLHTPGGDIAATEQIIKYLRSIFDGDIRAIIPQMAMSAGAMVAVSCKSIMMGKQSCLGPFDPQLNGVPCQSVIREFYKAVEDVTKNPACMGLWQSILGKLTPTFLTQCKQADELSEELTEIILSKSTLSSDAKNNVKTVFGKNSDSKTHSRHISRDRCIDTGLVIEKLEDDQEIQDLVLSIHHCCMILSEKSNVVKSVENNIGGAYICQMPMQKPPQ